MNTFHWSSSLQKLGLFLLGIISFSVGFWPIAGFGHPAGELYQQAVEAVQGENLNRLNLFSIRPSPNFLRTPTLIIF